jgi:hypothetical protein
VTAPIRTSEELRHYAATDVRHPIGDDELRDGFSDLIARSPRGLVDEHAFFALPATLSTWLDTGIECEIGDAVSLFTTGRTQPSAADAPLDPDRELWRRVRADKEARRGVWFRVGEDGDALRTVRWTHTFVASRAGRLFLAPAMNDESLPTSGNPLQSEEASTPRVDRGVVAVRWVGDPRSSLEILRAGGDVCGMLDCELARQRSVPQLPEGWHYPPLGGVDVFAEDLRPSQGPVLGCYTSDSGALLVKDASLPFLPGTKLRWAWKVDRLPSLVREDRLDTHDYLSIAVEFDNGRDLTYYWSAELPVDASYHCPVPGWDSRETHVVVRSGRTDLGRWVEEERDLHADYARHVGAPPSRIVHVWLLAVSMFQGGDGKCEYGRIELESGTTHLRLH